MRGVARKSGGSSGSSVESEMLPVPPGLFPGKYTFPHLSINPEAGAWSGLNGFGPSYLIPAYLPSPTDVSHVAIRLGNPESSTIIECAVYAADPVTRMPKTRLCLLSTPTINNGAPWGALYEMAWETTIGPGLFWLALRSTMETNMNGYRVLEAYTSVHGWDNWLPSADMLYRTVQDAVGIKRSVGLPAELTTENFEITTGGRIGIGGFKLA